MTLIVHTVVWGDYIKLFLDRTLPAILAAIKYAEADARLLIHTNDVARIKPHLETSGTPFEIVRIVIQGDKYVICAACEDDAFYRAKVGDIVASVNPDCVPSIELFAASQVAIRNGARIVGIHSPRVLGDPPVGATARALNQWNVDHFHPITRESHWGGMAEHPAHIYFRKGGTLLLHAFSYGPQVFFIDGRDLHVGTSREQALMDCFKQQEFALLLPAEAGFASVTPANEAHAGFNYPITVDRVVEWFPHHIFHNHYRWLFPIPIPVLGEPVDIGDREICRAILDRVP